MKLQSLFIEQFGKLSQTEITFDSRLTVLQGHNEAGKSTLHAFLRAMLFGLDRKRGRASKNDDYSRYLPWNGSSAFGGFLRFEAEDTQYLLHRTFQNEQKTIDLTDETHRIHLPEEELTALMGGLTPALYDNTISIGQLKSATGQSLADALQNHAGGFQQTGSSQIRLEAAATSLKQQKKKLEQELFPVTQRDLDALREEIRQAESQASETASLDAAQVEKRRQSLKTGLAAHTEEYRRLEQLLERSHNMLQASPYSDKEEVQVLQNKLKNAWSTRKQHLPVVQPVASVQKFLPLLSDLCYYGMLALFFLAGMQLFQKAYVPALLWTVGAVAFYLASCWFSVAAENQRTLSLAEDFLKDTFSREFPDTEVPELTEELYTSLDKRLDSVARLFHRTEQLKGQMSQLAETIFRCQEELSHMEEHSRAMQKTLWDAETVQAKRNGLYEKLEELEQKWSHNQAQQEEIAACERALQVFDQLSSQLRRTFSGPLHSRASQILSRLTSGKYEALYYGTDGQLFVTEGMKQVPLDRVSRGTIDQIYLALRLSAAEIFWPNRDMPLIFDDSFALYDEERLKAVLRYLHDDYPGQVLIFTCHDREARICKEFGLIHQVIDL